VNGISSNPAIRSRANHSASKRNGLGPFENPGSGRAAFGCSGYRSTVPAARSSACAAQPAGTRTWSEQRRSPGGSVREPLAGIDEPEAPSASGTAGVARRVAAREGVIACVPEQSPARRVATHGGDRLRRQRDLDLDRPSISWCDQARKAGLASIAKEGGVAGPRFRTDHRKGFVSDGMVIHTVVAKYAIICCTARADSGTGAGVEISRRQWTDG